MRELENEPARGAAATSPASQVHLNTPAPQETALFRESPRDVLPRAFGRYELRSLLGRGGMGDVYLAHDPALDRAVAIKIPRPFPDATGDWRARFLVEARAAATLQHPNICPVFEVGEVGSQPYLAMAYIEGETLADRLRARGKLESDEAVAILRPVARAMAEAHERGIVHRDLKPANIMIDRRGQPVVMDFGLALRCAAQDDLRLTLSGVAMGTPTYMPPEQAGGDHENIGPAADVYALGVVLFEMVTGQVPFSGKTFGKLLAQIERDPPPRPSALSAGTSPGLERIILKALEKEPQQRFATAKELADAVDSLGQESDVIVPPSRPHSKAQTRVESRTAAPQWLRGRSKGFRVALAALAIGFVLLLCGVIYVATDYGDLVVELSDQGAAVTVTVNGQEVILDPEGNPIRVRAGANQKLEVSGRDFETTSEIFELKRGNVKRVRVTLKPRPSVIPVPEGRPVEPVTEKPIAQVAAKPVAIPDNSTLIELSGWQILADATKEQLQAWLDERTRDKHSVMWLDCARVGDKPVFTAVAALDERASDWRTFLDLSEAQVNDIPKANLFPNEEFLTASITGFELGGRLSMAALFHRGDGQCILGALPLANVERVLEDSGKGGYVPRLLRPIAVANGPTWFGLYSEARIGQQPIYDLNLTEAQLSTRLDERRQEGAIPTSVAPYPVAGELCFAAAYGANRNRATWEVRHGDTASELQATAASLIDQGFNPSCVTVYTWDGAVRYCSVWLKEPPRPVVFPVASTTISQPGWETLVDASQEEMETWLAARKAARHSVVWLDSVGVGERPVFSGIAALDDRQPAWVHQLDLPGVAVEDGTLSKLVDTKTHRPIALSGYIEDETSKNTLLWFPETQAWIFIVEGTATQLQRSRQQAIENFAEEQILRPYPIGAGETLTAYCSQRVYGSKSSTLTDGTEAEMTAFVEARLAAGDRLISFAAYPKGSQRLYAVVAASNPESVPCELDHDLSVEQLKSVTERRAQDGYWPQTITACPWDGAVRYSIIWSKNLPSITAEPNGTEPAEAPPTDPLADPPADNDSQ